jgi:hypothetical protein
LILGYKSIFPVKKEKDTYTPNNLVMTNGKEKKNLWPKKRMKEFVIFCSINE